MPAQAREKRFKFIAFIWRAFFYPSRREGERLGRGSNYLAIINYKEFAKLEKPSDRIIEAS